MSEMPRHKSSLADHPDVREVIPVFVARLPGHVTNLRALLADGKAEELRVLAHKLRGSGRSFGFEPITQLAAALEEFLLAGGTIQSAAKHVAALTEYMEHIEGYGRD